jgi:hypothetical protein
MFEPRASLIGSASEKEWRNKRVSNRPGRGGRINNECRVHFNRIERQAEIDNYTASRRSQVPPICLVPRWMQTRMLLANLRKLSFILVTANMLKWLVLIQHPCPAAEAQCEPRYDNEQLRSGFSCIPRIQWRGAVSAGTVAICVGMIPALSSGINLSDHAARSMI